jgi:hypothetical protein
MAALNHSIKEHQHMECPVYAIALVTLRPICFSPSFSKNISLTTQTPFLSSRYSTEPLLLFLPSITQVMHILVVFSNLVLSKILSVCQCALDQVRTGAGLSWSTNTHEPSPSRGSETSHTNLYKIRIMKHSINSPVLALADLIQLPPKISYTTSTKDIRATNISHTSSAALAHYKYHAYTL